MKKSFGAKFLNLHTKSLLVTLGALLLVLTAFLTAPVLGGATTTYADDVPQSAWDVYNYASANNGAAQPGFVGNRNFTNSGQNGEQVLPTSDNNGNNISYQEYDVNPYQQGVNRGAERVVIGYDDSGNIVNAWYTSDHYQTFTEFV